MKLKLLVLSFLFTFSILLAQETIEKRFDTPKGYTRTTEKLGSFGHYLRNLPLKPEHSLVTYYNGNKKPNHNVYEAVVDLPIGNQNLHQCADAVMRLRADYFYQKQQFEQIHFNFTNGFRVDFNKWIQGYRIHLKGNTTTWVKKVAPAHDKQTYWEYLEQVFQFAGTASLSKELIPVQVSEIQIGDVFIKGGFPGHAVIVVDMAVNEKGKKVFLLAQSYMPAQEIQILTNPNSTTLGAWYSENFGTKLITPEWEFTVNQLKRF